MNFTSSETQTACGQKRSLTDVQVGIRYQDGSVKTFLQQRSWCFNDKYFSISSRHYSTIKKQQTQKIYMLLRLILKPNHFNNSHKEGKIGNPEMVKYFKCQTSYKSIFSVLTSEFICKRWPYNVLLVTSWTSPLVWTQPAILGSARREVCHSLY